MHNLDPEFSNLVVVVHHERTEMLKSLWPMIEVGDNVKWMVWK